MSTLEDRVAKLRALSTSNSEGWVREFDAGLAEIIATNDHRAIPLLFGLFNDNCEYSEAMYSVIHTVERDDDVTYVSHLLVQSQALYGQAPRWLSTLYSRVLNNDETRGELVKQLRTASPEVKQTVLKVIEALTEKRPQLAPKLIEVRTAALP